MLLNAMQITKTVQFIVARELNIFIESMEKQEVELLLKMKYEDIDEFQELLTEDYLVNYGIPGDALNGFFSVNINNLVECLGLRIEDFKNQIDEHDWQLYEKWIQRNNAKSA